MKIKSLMFAAMAVCLCVACTKDKVPTMDVTDAEGNALTSISLTFEGGEANANVISNCTWSASANANWITISPASYTNPNDEEKSTPVVITIAKNDGDARTAVITVTASEMDTPVQITVNQEESPVYNPIFTESWEVWPVSEDGWSYYCFGTDEDHDQSCVWGWAYEAQYYYGSSYWDGLFDAEAWLVSPVIDLEQYRYAILNFNHCYQWADPDQLTVWAAVDAGVYPIEDGYWFHKARPLGTWSQLFIPHMPSGDNLVTFEPTDDIDLSDFAGNKIRFAFRYIGTTTIAGTWQFDDIVVSAAE